MTWSKFLAALAAGGWSTDIEPVLNPKLAAPDEIHCHSTCDDVVIESRWKGVGRKFASATINGLEAGYAELAAVLA